MTRKIDLVVAAHEVHVESDDSADTLDSLADLAMRLYRDTEADARKSPFGFDHGGAAPPPERAAPYRPVDGEWGS